MNIFHFRGRIYARVSFPHRAHQGPCKPDGSIYAPRKLDQWKCDFSHLEWHADGQKEESCGRVDLRRSRSLASCRNSRLACRRRSCAASMESRQLHFITPGRPMENGYIESFNGKFRDECLNENWFFDLADAPSQNRRMESGLQARATPLGVRLQNADGICRFLAGGLLHCWTGGRGLKWSAPQK